MCKFTKKSGKKTDTGYKIACKVKGKYFSPVTGAQYLAGAKVPVLRKPRKKYMNNSTAWANVCDRDCRAFNPLNVGRTAVFKSKQKALDNLEEWIEDSQHELVLLEMIVSDDIMTGSYGDARITSGKYIISFEEV